MSTCFERVKKIFSKTTKKVGNFHENGPKKGQSAGEMRIDKFLKVSRILKRRTLAQEAASAGKISVNGKEVKPSHRVKAGDVVEVSFLAGVLKFRILEIKETVKKDDAQNLYEVIGE